MKASEKCVSKWEKRLAKERRGLERYGNSFYNNFKERIAVIEEILKDLKRITKLK